MNHLETCAVGQATDSPCQHQWSGWPGAVCLICGAEDPLEICLAGCECVCHDEFWFSYNAEMSKLSE